MAVLQTSEHSPVRTGDITTKGCKVYQVAGTTQPSHSYGGRDYYKIVLVIGDAVLSYTDQTIKIKGSFLFFANPNLPHTVTHRSVKNKIYACIFTEAFIAGRERMEALQHSPLFRIGANPVIRLDDVQTAFLTALYPKMLTIYNEDHTYKNELLKNCISLILYEALSIQPAQHTLQQKDAATRITDLFMELLERQFPIENTGDPLRLRTPQDFAGSLAVHVNYLNRSVKKITGHPTSVHIANRITAEAKALLQHSNWSVADIAYGLGFEYPTYFNNYFKRETGTTPNAFRKKKV